MLLTASHEKLLGYLMSLLGRWHDAQDVLQHELADVAKVCCI